MIARFLNFVKYSLGAVLKVLYLPDEPLGVVHLSDFLGLHLSRLLILDHGHVQVSVPTDQCGIETVLVSDNPIAQALEDRLYTSLL